MNEREEILLLAHPELDGGWQVVNGAMEERETVLDAVLRETYEEVGSGIQVHPLGTVHVSTFHYDERVRHMLSVSFLLAYEGGDMHPGDDMAGSEYRWWSMDELMSKAVNLAIPPGEKWILARAIDLYRIWNQEEIANLSGFNLSVRGK